VAASLIGWGIVAAGGHIFDREPAQETTQVEPQTSPPEEAPDPPVKPPESTTTIPKTVHLTALGAINPSADVDVDQAVTLNGRAYLNSIVYTCYVFCSDPKGIVEFNLAGRYTTFEATVGVADNAEETRQVGVFEIYLNDNFAGRWQATFGNPAAVTVNVAGQLRLKLVAARPGTVAGSPAATALAGVNAVSGESNGLPALVWAAPLVIA
jgi:hypothetical protein